MSRWLLTCPDSPSKTCRQHYSRSDQGGDEQNQKASLARLLCGNVCLKVIILVPQIGILARQFLHLLSQFLFFGTRGPGFVLAA